MNEYQQCNTFYTLYFHGWLLYLGCELNDKIFIFHVLNYTEKFNGINVDFYLRRWADKFCLHCNIFIYIRHIWIKPVLCSCVVSLFRHTSR